MPLQATFSHDRDDVIAAMQSHYPDFYGQYTALHLSGGEYRGKCPLHGGQRDSFSVNPESGFWHCHSECDGGGDAFDFLARKEGLDFTEALEALAQWAGTTSRTPSPKQKATGKSTTGKSTARRIAATYDYISETGDLLFQSVRYEPKGFSQRRPAGNGTWVYSLSGIQRVLYRLPQVMVGAATGKPVFVCEGEKDADVLAEWGLTGTTNPMGAGHWEETYTEALCGAGIVLLPDNDKAGRDHAQKVARALHGRAKRVRIVDLPGLPEKGDVSDWIETGGTKAALMELVKSAPDWTPDDAASEADTPVSVSSEAWEPPIPFTSHDLPAFPLEALPDALAGYVSEIAASTQVPADLPGMIGLSVVAAASVRRCIVQVGQTHIEPLNIYTCSAMPPGARKSAALAAMAAPLHEAEREMIAASTGSVAVATEARGVQDKRLSFLRESAAKAKDPIERESLMQDLAEEAMNLTDVPPLPRFLVDDVTPEKLAGLMADQNGCMALMSAESGIFGTLGGRYSDGKSNLDLFLKAHAGEPFRVDRQGRPSVSISRACLTMCLMAQPDVLESLADTPSFRGRGLLGRFLYSLPENLAGTRMYQNRPADAGARRRYEAAIHAILAMPEASSEDTSLRHVLHLDGAALDLWAEYANDIERRQAEGNDLSGICDWASKLAGAAARLAGGIHLVENVHQGCPWNVPVSQKSIAAAWSICEYLVPHALAAFGQMGADPRLVLARRILRWIEKSDLMEFTGSQCHQAHKNVVSADDLLPGLNLLVERGYLRTIQPESGPVKRRPKSPIYQVNPMAKYPKYPKN